MWQHQGYAQEKSVYSKMLAVKDMEHQIAVYTLIKLNQEHKLAPFLSQLLL